MDGGKLWGGAFGLRIAGVELEVIRDGEFFEEPEDPLALGVLREESAVGVAERRGLGR